MSYTLLLGGDDEESASDVSGFTPTDSVIREDGKYLHEGIAQQSLPNHDNFVSVSCIWN